ncbi:GNAT family N-acetyltransferase [Pokkaliibacter sp. MBI-7]|uniref:GNAT family N-acetyltransferase n=1 Tax=Pokkaliibacter sp. MBI-7 TaxID=3040600 RepID=UPI0024491AB7|nr:GNAT family N-acetyltransferase [Pokkaliibacter sp. MBI-7]MDH2435699.1 GNAT family N-acetyltransferase [Pokkaliibacter sp. MBI-7]
MSDSRISTARPVSPSPLRTLARLRNASDSDLAFASSLTRANMHRYYSLAGVTWSEELFLHYWQQTYNSMVVVASDDERFARLPPGIALQPFALGDSNEVRIGLVRLHFNVHSAFLWDLQLSPFAQGQGLGVLLLERVLHTCSQAGCRSMALDVYKNNPALQLYQRYGFVTECETEFELKLSRPLPYSAEPQPAPHHSEAVRHHTTLA